MWLSTKYDTATIYEYPTFKSLYYAILTSIIMTELPNKMKKKHIKYNIVKYADVIKLFLNKYVKKNTCRTEERTECRW